MQEGTSVSVATANNSNAAIISYANGALTIRIPTQSTETIVEETVVITAEVGLAILTALVPFVAFPAWLLILLPILRADIPLAETLFNLLAGQIQSLLKQGLAPSTVLQTIKTNLQETVNNNQPWY